MTSYISWPSCEMNLAASSTICRACVRVCVCVGERRPSTQDAAAISHVHAKTDSQIDAPGSAAGHCRRSPACRPCTSCSRRSPVMGRLIG